MTYLFECDGCGKHLPANSVFGTLYEKTDDISIKDSNQLCKDCYDATKQFLKDRYNNADKGINTGKRKK